MIKGKEIYFELAGNSSYPSSSYGGSTVHTSATYKRYLEVNKTSNIACRAELGRFPLNITINQEILNYILYIQSQEDEESFAKLSFFNVICTKLQSCSWNGV